MTKKKRYPLADISGFFVLFRRESDRACAVLGRALLEEHLRRLFEANFTEGTDPKLLLEDGQAPLATFSARIKVAAALGWFSEEDNRDLHTVREIGNDFAHGLDHEMSFEDSSIRDRVFAMNAPRIFLENNDLTEKPMGPDEVKEFQERPRRRYELAIGVLWWMVSLQTQHAKRAPTMRGLVSLFREARAQANKPTEGS